jgi:hypothetical protein
MNATIFQIKNMADFTNDSLFMQTQGDRNASGSNVGIKNALSLSLSLSLSHITTHAI